MFSFLRRKTKKATKSYKDPAQAIAAKDYESAIALYRSLLTRQPRKSATWHRKCAEALVLAERPKEAVEEYLAAAQHYDEEQLTLQALAMNKAVLRLDPENEDVRAMLGEIAQHESETDETTPNGDELGQMTIRTRLRAYAPLFSEFDYETLSAVVEVMETHEYESGHVIFRQGDPGDSLFIVASGEVALTVDAPTQEPFELERLGANACFGELSVLSRAPRNMTAVATRPTEVLELGRDYLEAVTIAHPQVWDILERYQKERLIPVGA